MFFQKKYKVLCIGSAAKDIFFPTDEGVVIDTPDDLTSQKKVAFELGGKQKADDLYEAVGGVAANVASGLSKLGVSTALYSNVGGDDTGKWIIRELSAAGVSTDRIFVDKSSKSDLSAIIVLAKSGERTIFHNRDANEKLKIVPKRLLGAEWFFISSLNGPWQENLESILAAAEEYGSKIAINPGQHNLHDDQEQILSAIRRSDILILNKDEALELVMRSSGVSDSERLNDEAFLLRSLRDAGAKMIGMTDGARGAWGYGGEEIWYCPIGTVEHVTDVTGAGDAFAAAFLAAYISGKPLPEMLAWGIAESGSVVTKYGAVAGQLSRDVIERIAKELKPERW